MEHIEVQKTCECLECLIRDTLLPICYVSMALLLFLVIFIIANLIIYGKEVEDDNK